MTFAHDTELALQAAAALVNTMPGTGSGDCEVDQIETIADLDAFLDAWSWSGRRLPTDEELATIKRLRPRLRTAWEGDHETVVDLVNGLLRDGQALPQLVEHDDLGWHIHAAERSASWPVRIAVEAAMALVDVIRMDELDRLRRCAREGCDDVFVDLSKNRSKRFCGTTCGNRENVAAYRARQAAATD